MNKDDAEGVARMIQESAPSADVSVVSINGSTKYYVLVGVPDAHPRREYHVRSEYRANGFVAGVRFAKALYLRP